ncbi:hypothetical protein BCV72DRAFT_275510 [Rhizopus microsporus var. microsporus]|uniref:Uncharacterized protein n=1 Tax=Rhizopus microsporus var. microsporus TaxID=86635 RepID=A0A1X0R1U1_RHIZD|nr:hypothetical protein BCV72DRAFT_275510 [Rhizopus microsporus var. microsporus]
MFSRQPVLLNEVGLIIPEFKMCETETWMNYLNKYILLPHGKALKNIKAAQDYKKCSVIKVEDSSTIIRLAV